MTDTRETRFWSEFCSSAGIDPATPYQAWYFCDTRDCANRLYQLVLDGVKRATACMANDLMESGMPRAGDISIVTDFDGEPKCVIRLTEVRIVPFSGVDEKFAYDEGEGDRTLDYWRKAHWDFFSRRCREIGTTPDEEMPIVCQRFEMLYPHGR